MTKDSVRPASQPRRRGKIASPSSVTVTNQNHRPTITIGLPSGWARAGLAAVMAALIGWFLPVVVAVIGFWTLADSPWMKQESWQAGVAVGSGWWAASLGSPALVGGIKLSLIPLVWTFSQILILRALLQNVKAFSGSSSWAAVPFFALTAVILLVTTVEGGSWWKVMLGAALVAAVTAAWASKSFADPKPQWVTEMRRWWPGVRLGLVWLLGVAAAAGVAVFWAWAAREKVVGAAGAALGSSGADHFLLALIQFMYFPVILAWALSWIMGVGFRGVGGAMVSPSSPPEESLPLPVWQFIPTEPVPFSSWWVVGAGILLGLVSGWALRKRPEVEAIIQLVVATGTFLLVLTVWMFLSRGGLGDNQLASLGPPVLSVIGSTLLLIVLPAVLVAAAMHPFTIAAAKTIGKAQWQHWSGRAEGYIESVRTKSKNQHFEDVEASEASEVTPNPNDAPDETYQSANPDDKGDDANA